MLIQDDFGLQPLDKKTIAGVVMDRITHQAARIELHGESIRKICGKK